MHEAWGGAARRAGFEFLRGSESRSLFGPGTRTVRLRERAGGGGSGPICMRAGFCALLKIAGLDHGFDVEIRIDSAARGPAGRFQAGHPPTSTNTTLFGHSPPVAELGALSGAP